MVNHRGRQHYSSALPAKQWLSMHARIRVQISMTKLRLPCVLASPLRLLSGCTPLAAPQRCGQMPIISGRVFTLFSRDWRPLAANGGSPSCSRALAGVRFWPEADAWSDAACLQC